MRPSVFVWRRVIIKRLLRTDGSNTYSVRKWWRTFSGILEDIRHYNCGGMTMTSTELKHEAKLQEWQGKIMDCRSQGIPVNQWCQEHRINKAAACGSPGRVGPPDHIVFCAPLLHAESTTSTCHFSSTWQDLPDV